MDLKEVPLRARRAQRQLASAPGETRTAVLRRLAALLEERRSAIMEANQRDLAEADRTGLQGVLLKRLALTDTKFDGLIDGVRQIASMVDPLGRNLRATVLDTDLNLRQVTSPLGVVLIIFESRPDAVVQIGSLILRTGNGVVMKGGSEARLSNQILTDTLREALESSGLSPDVVINVEGRAAVSELLALEDGIDLVIPRGSNSLVRSIQAATRIPVLGHADGICHIYIAPSADLAKAVHITVDSKLGYPSACNAVETLLVHPEFFPKLPELARALHTQGVELRADPRTASVLSAAEVPSVQAKDTDFGFEFGDLTLAVKTVDSLDDAIEHLHEKGSQHTDAIVTESREEAETFLNRVDSASVFHNASTRFADGFRYGLGAEVGISTGRIHARGPVGVDGLLTTRWLLRGDGQSAGDYGPGKKAFLHTPLNDE